MMYFEGDGDETENLAEFMAQLPDAEEFKKAQCVFECGSRFNASPDAIGRIWLSGFWATQDVKALAEAGVSCLLTLNGRRPAWLSSRFKDILKDRGIMMRSVCVDIEDDECEDITPFFEQCFKAIDQSLDEGSGILVHCTAGRSRSATVVIAYLVAKCGFSLQAAYQHVKKRRRWIQPNRAFVGQLHEFDRVCAKGRGKCDLCRLEKRTAWLDDSDPRFVVIECDQCDLPMAVWRTHQMRISPKDNRDMETALLRIAQ
eukprot:INCI7003.3.p1 GENE.INCI7003.3~~INCI7003.3.p1  ORF type:complete len:258 (+),score=40.38 INCI7003.3:266-1039(+)